MTKKGKSNRTCGCFRFFRWRSICWFLLVGSIFVIPVIFFMLPQIVKHPSIEPFVKTHVALYVEAHEPDKSDKPDKPKESVQRLTQFGEFAEKIVIPFGVGIGAIIAISIGFWELMKQRWELVNQRTIARKTLEHTQKGVAAERFNNAIINLGHERRAVVLGGIYALNTLARHYNGSSDKCVPCPVDGEYF